MRIGLIGVGKHGRRYASHVRADVPGLILAGVARRDAVRVADVAQDLGCRGFATCQELIAKNEVEAVIAVVPPAFNEEIVTLAARAGKPLLLEKPATVSVAAGRRMLATVREHGAWVSVAHTVRYNGVVAALRDRLPEIGPLHAVTLTQRFERSTLHWLDDPARAGGGITLHTGVHSFDLVRHLTGAEVDSVTGTQGRVWTRHTEDSFAATLSLNGGDLLAIAAGSRAAVGRTGYIELAGAGGTLIGDHVANTARLMVGSEVRPIDPGPPIPTVRDTLRAFAAALAAGGPPPIPLEEGLRAVAIADACTRAARTGKATAVEPIE
ncbi:MAG: Gfo/Idh/MocA family oxidoreductase [Nitrospirota bacterium]